MASQKPNESLDSPHTGTGNADANGSCGTTMIAPDGTLGGYLDKHTRPPAFEGSDGSAYSVEIWISEPDQDDGHYAASLLFVRWSTDGAQPVGHVETPFLAQAKSRREAKAPVLAMSLHDIKELLDQLIQSQDAPAEW